MRGRIVEVVILSYVIVTVAKKKGRRTRRKTDLIEYSVTDSPDEYPI